MRKFISVFTGALILKAGNTNQVPTGLRGHFSGSEVLKVSGGTFDPNAPVTCGPECATANATACANDWVNASAGNGGDIATIC